MARISGLSFEKYSNGSIRKVTFDYKKHGELLKPLLENMGVVEKDNFDVEFEKGYTTEEAIKETQKRIRKWFK